MTVSLQKRHNQQMKKHFATSAFPQGHAGHSCRKLMRSIARNNMTLDGIPKVNRVFALNWRNFVDVGQMKRKLRRGR